MSFFRAVIYLLTQRRVYPYIAYRGMAFQKFRWEVLTVKYAPRKYTNLLTSGRLNTYLADIDRQAQERFERLIEGMKQAQGITERLKEENALEWVQHLNNIRACARETVNKEIIYN